METKPQGSDHSADIKETKWNPVVVAIAVIAVIIFFAAGSYVSNIKIARPDAGGDTFTANSSVQAVPKHSGDNFVPAFTQTTSTTDLPAPINRNKPRAVNGPKAATTPASKSQEVRPSETQPQETEQSTLSAATTPTARETSTATSQSDTGSASSGELSTGANGNGANTENTNSESSQAGQSGANEEQQPQAVTEPAQSEPAAPSN